MYSFLPIFFLTFFSSLDLCSSSDYEKLLTSEKSSLAKLLDEKDKLEFEFEETRSRLEESDKNLASSKDYVDQLESERRSLQQELQAVRKEMAAKDLQALEGERTTDTLLQGELVSIAE